MGPLESGDIGAAATDPTRPSFHPLRVGTGLLLLLAALAAAFAWGLRADERVVSAVYGWRVAVVALVGAVLLNAPLLGPLWRGKMHLSASLTRPVPFAPAEFAGRGRLNPGRTRAGVSGRAALLGVGLAVLGALCWSFGLAFAPLDATGTVSLRAGQSTSDTRPTGLRVGDRTYAHALPHEHIFFGLTDDRPRAAVLRAQDPRTGSAGEYAVTPGEPVPLGPHHVSLVSTALGPPLSGLRLRVQAPNVDEVVTLRERVPVPVGSWLFELLSLEANLFDGPLEGARVRVSRGEQARELWLLPGAPELDARFGSADDVVLTPLEILGTQRIVLRFTQRWVWVWRLTVLGLVGLGSFLILLVPHRTWLWTGRPGDYQLRAWSLNATGALWSWSEVALREAMGEEAYEELCAIEAELAGRAGAPT